MKFEEILPGLREGRFVSHGGEVYQLTEKGLVSHWDGGLLAFWAWTLDDDGWEFSEDYNSTDDKERKISKENMTLGSLKKGLVEILVSEVTKSPEKCHMEADALLLMFINDKHVSKLFDKIHKYYV